MDRDVQRTRQRTVRWLNCSQAVSSAKPFQAFSSSSVQASAHECQPGTGSLCRSRSNNSSLPSFCEYSRFTILNHVLCSRSATWGADFCLAMFGSEAIWFASSANEANGCPLRERNCVLDAPARTDG